MQVIKKLYLYIFLALVPSTIQATSTLEKIDQCIKYVEAYRQSKAIFHDAISQDIDRKIVLYLPSKDCSRMRGVSASCYNTIESVDHQKLLMKINSGKVDGLDDKTIRELRKGDCYATLSFFLNEYHSLSKDVNSTIPWLRILTRSFPIHVFECFEQKYDKFNRSLLYSKRPKSGKEFILAFYKAKGLRKNKFSKLSFDLFNQFIYWSLEDVNLAIECIKHYLNYDMANYMNKGIPYLSREKINFNQLKQYLVISYKKGYLPLFGETMIRSKYVFKLTAKMCLQNKEQGKKLLGELCYVAFHHNSTKESMEKYNDIRKYIKNLKGVYKNQKDLGDSDFYQIYSTIDEVLGHLSNHKNLSLLTALAAGLYYTMR